MSPFEVRFAVAGLEVLLCSRGDDGLAGLAGLAELYRLYPSAGGAASLILELERVPGLSRDRQRGPEYPAFRRQLAGPGRLALSRFDAEGEMALSDDVAEPVRGQFRVGECPNSLEALIRIGLSLALVRRGGLVLHASSILAGSRALVFAGVSGAGKSTIAELLVSTTPGLAKLADELVILVPDADDPDGGARAYAAPFLGSAGLAHGRSAPVAGIHFLVQAGHHTRTALPTHAALRALLEHVLVYAGDAATASHVLDAAARLVTHTPCYSLAFARDRGVAEVLGIT